jgi:hypothetical protein
MGARNRVGIGLSYRLARLRLLAGQYNNSVPTRFLAPIDCSKILALYSIRECRGCYPYQHVAPVAKFNDDIEVGLLSHFCLFFHGE